MYFKFNHHPELPLLDLGPPAPDLSVTREDRLRSHEEALRGDLCPVLAATETLNHVPLVFIPPCERLTAQLAGITNSLSPSQTDSHRHELWSPTILFHQSPPMRSSLAFGR
jgi:hypothetical protein